MWRALPLACGVVLLAWSAGAGAGASGSPELRNGKIAFVSAGDIWIVNPDGNELVNLTHSGARDVYPSWSPEGTRIVFSSNRSGGRDLWIMDASGEGLRRLTRNRVNGPADSCPTISPDGRQLAFARRLRGNQELYIMNLDGTGLRRLTRFPGIDFDPAWSPDGSEIAFWRQLRRGRRATHQIFVVNPDDGHLRRLTWGASTDAPTWSPDGKRIAYTRNGRARGDVWTMRADGTGQVRFAGGPANDDDAAWAPDGMFIAFTSDRFDETANLFVVNTRGPRRQTRLTRLVDSTGRLDALTPAWQPVR
jgi:Tol biopolymer transport system component